MIVQKLKDHSDKVLQTAQDCKTKRALEAQRLREETETKLKNADAKREQLLESVKLNAQKFQHKRTSSTEAPLSPE